MAKEETGTPMTVKELAAMGGRARAQALSREERKQIARDGANAMWAKKRAVKKAKKKS